jgi:ribonuclease D
MNLIENTADLKNFCDHIIAQEGQGNFISIDTEFIRETRYWPKLCLIQIASDQDDAIIDPLFPNLDLKPMYELLEHPNILKVFHGSKQDLEIFYQLTGKIPDPIFDTQIGAMVTGFGDSIGYEALVRDYVGIAIDKSSRFTNWEQRPLSEKQLNYARSDVIHLRTVYEKIINEIKRRNRVAWIEEELNALKNPNSYKNDPQHAWRRIRSRTKEPRFLAKLQATAAVRETEAQRLDVPKGRLLRDDVLLEVTAYPPKNVEGFLKLRGIKRNYVTKEFASKILEAISKASLIPLNKCPHLPDKTPFPKSAGPIVDLLKVLLKSASTQHGVAKKLIANTEDLEKIALEKDPDIQAIKLWRYEIFGKDALNLKAGKIGLTIQGQNLKIIQLTSSKNSIYNTDHEVFLTT